MALYGETGLAALGGSLMGADFCLLALAHKVGLAGGSAFGARLSFYMMHSTLQTNATQMAPTAQGTAMAVFGGCLLLGQSVGPGAAGLCFGWPTEGCCWPRPASGY